MLLKAGVDISRLKRPIRRALAKIGGCFRITGEELVITSTYEGDHGESSLHYSDEAVDVRRPGKAWEYLWGNLKNDLGDDYDVVLRRDHIHIEYDPKR